MAMPGSSRSKKILALIEKNRNKAPDQESTMDKSSYERLKLLAPPGFDIRIQVPLDSTEESNANRGVNDLGTYVYKYLEQVSSANPQGNIHVIFYSDNCPGQQKNKAMVAMYLLAVQKLPHIQTITHKYLIKGHTQNEGDAAHSLIKRQVKKLLKGGPMYSPEAFIGAIKSARKKPEPFHVNEMCTEDFFDWKDACSQMGVNISKNEEGNSVKIADVKILRVEKNSSRTMYYKTSYAEEEFKRAVIIKKKIMIEVDVKKAYDETRCNGKKES